MTTVPCYPLSRMLAKWRMEVIQPCMRETFTETWRELCRSANNGWFDAYFDVRQALRNVSGISPHHDDYQDCSREEGYEIERRLYARAIQLRLEPVQGPPRSTINDRSVRAKLRRKP